MKLLASLRHLSRRSTLIAVFTVLALGTLIPVTAFAASPTTTKCASNDTQCFITLGDSLISARQTSLNTLNGKVTERLNQNLISSDDANVLQSDITTNEQGLTALQTKLNGETSTSAAKQDVQNIFFQFRIYAVVLPRDYRRLYLDVARTIDGKLRALAPKLQDAIKEAPASEQQQLQPLYNDYIAQLGTAEGQFDAAAADIVALTPENFNYNRSTYESTLSSLKTSLQTIHTALHQAASDVHQMAQILKEK
jgi:hypothetical protein